MVTIVTSRFPFISLEKALQKAQSFLTRRGDKAMPVTTAFQNPKKEQRWLQTTSALKVRSHRG
jgi:hypothetical protein